MKRIIEQYNDQLAKVYDTATHGEFKWKAPQGVNKILLPLLKKNSKILDLGIGTGQSSAEFYKTGHKVVGIDISNEMLKIVKKKFPKIKLLKFDIENDLEKLDLEPSSFNGVIGVGIFEFIKNLRKLFSQIAKVVKKDGYFCFTFEEFLKDHPIQGKKIGPLGEGLLTEIPKLLSFKVYRRTKGEIEKLLKDFGFKVLVSKKFTGYLRTKKKIPVHYQLILAKKIKEIY